MTRPDPRALQARWEWALEVVVRAGELLQQGYEHVTEVRFKGEIDLVTEYDLRAEQLLIEALKVAFPSDAILAEESGAAEGGDWRWLIDPLDGTTNFAHGVPYFCISLACVWDGVLQLGVVYEPLRRECFQARRGQGAWLGERRLAVSKAAMLRQSLLVTGFMTGPPALVERNLEHFNALTRRTRAVRRLGSAALDLAYVASGRFDAYWHLALNAWDWAAGALLVQEAGGRVTTLDQGLLQPGESSSILACNVQLYPRLQAALHPQWMIEDDEAGR